MILYLDSDFRAHVQQDETGTLIAWEDDGFFTGKCDVFIEGYRVVPEGETWTREDGRIYTGLMISPMESQTLLQATQAEADKETIATLDAAVVNLTYDNILLELEV